MLAPSVLAPIALIAILIVVSSGQRMRHFAELAEEERVQVLRAVEKVTGKSVPHKIAPRREGDPRELVADSTKLRKTLGWEPRHSGIEEIVRDAWAYYQLKFK